MPTQHLLDLINMGRDPSKGRSGIGQRQQVVQKFSAMGGPCQMFRETGRLRPIAQAFEPRQMFGVQRPFAPDRQANAVDGQRKAI